MRASIFLLLFCVLAHFAYSQTGNLSGQITSNGQPVSGAVVLLNPTDKNTLTDSEGNFSFNALPAGSYHLVIHQLGFEKKTVVVNFLPNPTKKLNIQLTESVDFLAEVVVSGTLKEVRKSDSPVPVDVYGRKFLMANASPNLMESMQYINGIRPQINCSVCNTGDISINGLPGPYTMVLIDGMPIVSGLSTVYGFSGIPQFLIERIEVVKGPASTLYGSEAVGGLINIITENCDDQPKLTIDAFGTSWAEFNLDAGISLFKGKKAQSIIGLNLYNYSLPIDNNGDGFTDITLQNRFSLFNKWSIKMPGNTNLSLAGRYIYEDRWGGEMNWEPQFYGSDSIYGESINTKRWELMANYKLPVHQDLNFQFSANGHQQKSAYGTTIYNADQYIGFGQLTWRTTPFVRHEVLMGLATRYTFYDDNTVATQIDDSNQFLTQPAVTWLPGVFVQDEISLNSQNKLLLATRWDYNSVHGNIISPRINYKWNSLNQRTAVRVGLGNGYRVANVFTEDHAALTGARTVTFTENLAPETSWNMNVNAIQSWSFQNKLFLELDGSAFYTYFTNQIIPDYDTDPNQIIYSNLDGYAVSQGVSLNVNSTLPNGISMNMGITAMDNFYQENGEKLTPYFTENFRGVWRISFPMPRWKTTIDYTGNVTGPMKLPLLSDWDPRSQYSDWWSIQNIQITKVLPRGFTVYGGIKNLLNYTPFANSIARANDPFDKNVTFDQDGTALRTPNNPYGLTFDPAYVYAPNQGTRVFIGFRYQLK